MELKLQRQPSTAKATLGDLYVDDVHECVTLEDVVRPSKIYGETAIPAGRYKVIIDFSQRFQKNMLHVLDVPNFTGIRIHSGNTDHDTLGCILVGRRVINADYIQGGSVALPALQAKIAEALATGDVYITIYDA